MTAVTPPTAVRVGAWPVGSPEWHAARANGLGGSEIAAVLGLSKWESRFSLWHRKAGLIPDQPENDEMTAGKLLEPVILQRWEHKQQERLRLLNNFPGKPSLTYAHRDRPWQIANPDGLAVRATPDGLRLVKGVEAKFALYDDEWGTPGTDEIPPYYLAQVRWYIDALGLDEFDIEVFFGSSARFETYTVRADEADQAFLRARAQEFLDTLPGRPNEQRPDIDAHGATYQAVRALHPLIDGGDVEIDPVLADAYRDSCAALKDAEAAKQKHVSLVLDAMGNARRALALGEPVALRVPGRGDNPPFLRPARATKTKAAA